MKTLFLKLWSWVTGSSIALYHFLAPIFASSVAKILTELAPVALDIVAGLEGTSLSGSERKRLAMQEVKAIAIRSGIEAGTDAISSIIELAVLHLRARGDG
jgi:hypothetical protein